MVEALRVPERTNVVVIGGGIVGVVTALFLADRGIPVVLCEKGRIAGEQSSRNWGWIRKAGRDPRELQLMIESAAMWKDIAARLGEDIGYGIRGITYLAETDEDLARHEEWLESTRGFAHGSRLLSSQETDDLLKRNDRKFAGALHTASDASAEPALAVPAMARLAARQGASVLENCAVRSVERSGGKVRSVVTEHGEIACETVVLAGGVWSRTFLENLGLSLPQLAVKSSVMRTTPGPEVTAGALGAGRASLRRRQDGGYTIARSGAAEFQLVPAAFRHFRAFLPVLAERWRIMKLRVGPDFFGPLGHQRWKADETTPFEAVRVMDPTPDARLLANVLASAKSLHPRLEGLEIAETWGGLIDVMPDEVPVIDQPPGWDGLVIATGLSGHGFGIGPGVARLVLDRICGEAPMVDMAPFALSRFSGKRAKAEAVA
ncbi:MAG: D-amino-acid oxidase [Stappia sp.]|uniref:NAD(P)/FAD-dependent oxidoreductase n=1 Tax=Stappia sp. TaxID=1870903 RepID=UPI000C63E96A|nr:FAD-binding oxidoreductase [Stappia sp.]MAB00734.1 D-amino-acid oxidase [Stappia sp.]MBM18804.1 D-amino-acid oxidase [Stappia sp.]